MHQNRFYIDHLQSFSYHSWLGIISEKVNPPRQAQQARRQRPQLRHVAGASNAGGEAVQATEWPDTVCLHAGQLWLLSNQAPRPLSPPDTEEMVPPKQNSDQGRVAAEEEAAPALLFPLRGSPPRSSPTPQTSGHSRSCSLHLNCTVLGLAFYQVLSHWLLENTSRIK